MSPIWVPGLLVVCGALLGWLTNCLAIWMLFHPRRSLGVSRFRIQGFIPSRREEIAETVARAIAAHLLDEDEIRNIIGGVDISAHVRPVVNEIVARELSTSLGNRFRITAAIQQRVIVVVQERLGVRVAQAVDELREEIIASVLHDIDVESHLRRRLAGLDLDRLEQLVWDIGRRELRMIEYLGGVIGAVVGLVQGILYLLFLGK